MQTDFSNFFFMCIKFDDLRGWHWLTCRFWFPRPSRMVVACFVGTLLQSFQRWESNNKRNRWWATIEQLHQLPLRLLMLMWLASPESLNLDLQFLAINPFRFCSSFTFQLINGEDREWVWCAYIVHVRVRRVREIDRAKNPTDFCNVFISSQKKKPRKQSRTEIKQNVISKTFGNYSK